MTAPVVLRVDPAAPSGPAIQEAARRLRAGGLVAFPTETVYGLGANALDPEAVARIYAAKGRPSDNPLICHLPDTATARHTLAAEWPPAAAALAEAFWPGPLTLVLPARAHLPSIVTAGTGRVAIRVPSHPVAQALLAAAGRPIAAPSANRSTALSPTEASHVLTSLGARAECVLDGGPSEVGIESTIVDLTGPRPVLLRPGSISAAALEAVVGPLAVAEAVDATGSAARSPGRQARHYAPTTPLRLVARFEPAVEELRGALTRTGTVPEPPDGMLVRALPADAAGFARRLYAALHELDAAGCVEIQVLTVPDSPEWLAVRDRLGRAAHRPLSR